MQPIIFRDRIDAANKLAEELKQQLMKPEHRDSSSIVVLSIPRGGVVIGDVVADKLNVKLHVVVSRKIGAPIDPEVAIGAVMPDGTYLLNDDIMVTLNDGIATGATMLSAAQWLITKQNCQELIIAVPVAPRDTLDKLRQIVAPEPF